MEKDLNELMINKDNYDEASQEFIQSLNFSEKEISELNTMKQTQGWKLIETKIRQDLHNRIFKLVDGDVEVTTLLALLYATNTKELSKKLEQEIASLLNGV